jgi:putative methionine-R-sulfoxide reductase with GAF domain
LHAFKNRSTLLAATLPDNCFFADVRVYDVNEEGQLTCPDGAPIEALALAAIDNGTAEVSIDRESLFRDSSAAIAIPVFRNGRVVSTVVLSARSLEKHSDELIGIFEVWSPVGIYEELSLASGYFGRMERFQNVSSFVRFEKGTGLPGQVWQRRMGVIHDDLSNHPGFLRAAGASADSLTTALGIPVASSTFHGVAVLISSKVTPMTRGFEVWKVQDNHFQLVDRSYAGFSEGVALPLNATLRFEAGLPGLANDARSAVVCDDVERVFAGRNHDVVLPESASGLAIPFFDGDRLSSVTNLLF